VADRVTSVPSKSAMSVAMALLLISGMWAPILGPAAPVQEVRAEWSEECDLTDSAIGAVLNTLAGEEGECRWVSGNEEEVENLTETDAYAAALAMNDGVQSYTTTTENFMQNSRTVAMSKGKIELINQLNNDTSVSEAKLRVNESLEDYYARVQLQVLKDHNAKMQQLKYLHNTSVTLEIRRDPDGPTESISGFENHSYMLVNGSTYHSIAVLDGAGDTAFGLSPTTSAQYEIDWDMNYNDRVYAVSSDGTTVAFDGPEYSKIMDDIRSQLSWAKQNMAPYTDEVYNQYNAGEIDATDLATADPSVIAAEASTDRATTGSYSYAAIQLAALGSSGNVNVSHTITTSDGTTLNGSLYYTDEDMPADGWKTGKTYSFSNFNGTFYMAVAKDDGNATIVNLGEYGKNFTISEAKNTETGEAVNTTKVETYTYESTNASNLKEEIEKLKELRETYKQQAVQGSGGTGCLAACGDGSSVLPEKTGLYVVLGLAAIILLSRP